MTDQLVSLYPKTSRKRKRLMPERMRNSLYRCIEFPDGIFIDCHGNPVKDHPLNGTLETYENLHEELQDKALNGTLDTEEKEALEALEFDGGAYETFSEDDVDSGSDAYDPADEEEEEEEEEQDDSDEDETDAEMEETFCNFTPSGSSTTEMKQ